MGLGDEWFKARDYERTERERGQDAAQPD